MRKALILLSALFVFVPHLFAQEFILRNGRDLTINGQKILLRGFSFGNRVWSDDPLPEEHHTEEDYQIVSELGMNAIRFYMNYLTFEDDTEPYVYKESGWEWVDRNIEWAKKNDIYLILNMHVPQGGFQSRCEGQDLWEVPENRARLAALWKAIAEHYKDEPQIAGYDIVNEPTPTESVDQWSELAQRIIDSIRSVDTNHLIITERAIAVGCDYGVNDGNYNYPDITEENLMYTVHMYDPYEYTHQNQPWANTGDGGSYPDLNKASAPPDLTFATGHYNNPVLPEGTTDWKYYEGEPFQVEADSIIMGDVVFYGHNLADGIAWYDDFTLSEVDENGEVIRTIYDENLSSGQQWFWSENEDGEYSTSIRGHDDSYAITCTGTTGNATIGFPSFRFRVEKGKRYKISGWMKGENIPAGAQASISTEFYYSPSGQEVTQRNYEYLKNRILDYSQYIRDMGYPVYFGVVRNAFENDKGGERWLSDVLRVYDSLDFHFTYHVYRENAFGYFTGTTGPVDYSERNILLENTFKEFFQISGLPEKNIKAAGVEVFPNPFNRRLNIRNIKESTVYLQMTDSRGKEIWDKNLTSGDIVTFEKQLKPGVYFLSVTRGSKKYTTKVIKSE